MVNYLRTLIGFGYRVTFIPESDLLHFGRYTTTLQAMGVECLYHPYITSGGQVIEKRGNEFDAIMLVRVTVAFHLIAKVRACCPRARIIFNTVDLHFLREQRLATLETGCASSPKAEEMKRKELAVMARADVTIVIPCGCHHRHQPGRTGIASARSACCPCMCHSFDVRDPRTPCWLRSPLRYSLHRELPSSPEYRRHDLVLRGDLATDPASIAGGRDLDRRQSHDARGPGPGREWSPHSRLRGRYRTNLFPYPSLGRAPALWGRTKGQGGYKLKRARWLQA